MAEAKDKAQALIDAAWGGDLERLRGLVLSDGVSLNAKGWYGETALMHASEKGKMDVVRFLVERGADAAAVNVYGWTALMYASLSGNMDVIRFLVERGADMAAVDNDGKTALMFASLSGKIEVVRFFVERGADVTVVDKNGKTALMLASEKGKMDVARFLVELGADLAAVDKYGKAALMYASENSKMDVVRFLVERGADVTAVDKNGKTALMLASEKGDMDVVRFLVERGADVAAVDQNGKTALVYASYKGKMDVVRFLVKRGADVAAVDEYGKTAMMYASQSGNMDVARFLVERGTDVDAVDNDGSTALMYASENGKMDVVRFLVEGGADVAAVDNDSKTALMLALEYGKMDVARFLVERGADVTAVDKNGKTALMLASEDGKMDVVRFLVERGADMAAVGYNGRTALMLASERGNIDVVRVLVERGADVAAVDQNGKTALVYASYKGKMDVVRFLVKRGADVAAVDEYGKTAMMYASQSGNMDVARFLVERGTDVDAVDNDGSTALMYALLSGNMEVARFLVKRGADVAAVNKNGRTALMFSSQSRKMDDVVGFLVERGADVAAVDKNGWTALMHALWFGKMDVARFLVERGADVAAVVKYGRTALMFASEVGNMDVVRFLVERGTAVDAVDNDGKTALMYASQSGNMDVVRFLVEQGADVNVEDAAGHTALFHCSSKGHDQIQRFLIPLVQQRNISSNSDEYQEATTQSASSWFISPFEIELLNLIDQEGVGVQFRAKWLDAEVAVKLFIPGASRSSFAEEVTMWRHLRHPNVIKLYGACNVGHFFFVSELASNGSVVEHLAACRDKGIKCTPWKFLHEAALGLAYLHERKMVHGDLRGSNILIGSDGLAKLSGFALSGSTRTSGLAGSTEGGVFGSTRWQSPERVKGGEATCGSDVYSLGLCIVEAVSGEIPWKEWSENFVMLWKKDWDPAINSRTILAPWSLIDDDVLALVGKMCALDPAQRVTAAVAAQMLERLSTTERQAASQQPESEPQTSIDEFKGGELRRLWDGMLARMSTVSTDTILRNACEEIQAMREHLGQTNQPWNVVDQFHRLLVDIDSMLGTDSYENQIQRLSSTRATRFAMDGIRRRLDALWTSIGGSKSSSRESQKQRWREERVKQLDLFVSEVEKTLLVVNELETEEDCVALLAILKSEKDNPMSKYTPGQLLVIKKAYDNLAQQMRQKQDVTKSDAVTTTPEWFLPWYELEIDKLSCVGTGGFGGVYRGRWLESEVVVKLLDQGDSRSMNDNSFASTVSSSYWSTSRMPTPSDPTTREERAKVREMFAREVGVWFGLSHPHVVRLFGACHVGTLFFACEFASNGSLDKYLRKHPDELWRKLYEGALGVQYLHSRGIVHGDLKCNNILVGSDGKAKVTDFGLSSDAAVLDKAGAQVSGAWQWVAPECLKHGSSRLSSASDVYSLGMCIVEALRVVEATTSTETERAIVPLPWGNLDNAAVKYHVVRKQALPLRPSVCTDEQWMLVTRMCAFNPSDRLHIGTVVDILGRFAGIDVPSDSEAEDTDAGAHAHALGLEDISAAVAEMKSCIDADQVAEPSNRKTLTQIFGLLWSRLDDLSRVLGDGSCGDIGKLCELVDRSRQSTMAMQEQGSSESLIAFTEMAMRGYALHRGLDKLMEANRWRVDSEEGCGVHDWRRRCNEFLGVTADTPGVNETVKALEVETEQTMQA